MHKIFGLKENADYIDREGAYLIPIHKNKVGVVQTKKGLFFVGGGIETGENKEQCIKRECIEEIGFAATIKAEVCSAETFCKHKTLGYFHPIQTYFIGELQSKIAEPLEKDHFLVWIEYDKLNGKMYFEMQNWALECVKAALKRYFN